MSPFSLVLDIRAQLGECPLWSVDEQVLYFVDIKGRVRVDVLAKPLFDLNA
jgi:sugar lactone lactonase YvrE